MDEILASGTQVTPVTLPEEDEQRDLQTSLQEDPLHGIGNMLGLSLDQSILSREGNDSDEQREEREQEEIDGSDCDR